MSLLNDPWHAIGVLGPEGAIAAVAKLPGVMVYTHDLEGVFQYVSDGSRDIFGVVPADARRPYADYMTDHPDNQIHHHTLELINAGAEVPVVDYQVRRHYELAWVEIRERCVMEEGRSIGSIGLCCDVTRRHAREEEHVKRLAELDLHVEELREEDMLAMCGHCMQVEVEGGWQRVDSYLRHAAGLHISHGICPTCLRKYHPDLAEEILSGHS